MEDSQAKASHGPVNRKCALRCHLKELRMGSAEKQCHLGKEGRRTRTQESRPREQGAGQGGRGGTFGEQQGQRSHHPCHTLFTSFF